MNDDQASRLFDRLGADIPDRRPAMDHLVHAGRAARHRRRTTRAVLAACVATAVVLVGGAVALGGSAPSAEVTPATTSVPQAPDGMRLVGRGRAVVAVPAGWANLESTCVGIKGHYMLFGPPQGSPCQDSYSGPHSKVAISRIGGSAVHERPVSCDVFGCGLTLSVPSEDARFIVSATGKGSATVVRRIRDSLQLLPEGFTTVPYVAPGTSAADARDRLSRVGLVLSRAPRAAGDVAIGFSMPGSVVRRGSAVSLWTYTFTRLVTSPDQIVGTWVPIKLYGEPVTSKAALVFRAPHGSRPPTYTVDDEVNISAGKYAVSPDGAFEARVGVSTAVGCVHNRPGGCQIRSRDAVEEATMLTVNLQDRLVMRGADGTEIATYERASVRSSR